MLKQAHNNLPYTVMAKGKHIIAIITFSAQLMHNTTIMQSMLMLCGFVGIPPQEMCKNYMLSD